MKNIGNLGNRSGNTVFSGLLLWLFLSLVFPLSAVSATDAQTLAGAPESTKVTQPATELINIRNRPADAHRILGQAASGQLPPAKTLQLYEQAIALAPDYAFPELALSRYLFSQHHFPLSLSHLAEGLKKAKQNPDESFALYSFIRMIPAIMLPLLAAALVLLFTLRYFRAFIEVAAIRLYFRQGIPLLIGCLITSLLVAFLPAPILGFLALSALLSFAATRRDMIILTILLAALLPAPLFWEQGLAGFLAMQPAQRSGSANTSTANNVINLFQASEKARQNGAFEQAMTLLEKVIELKPEAGAPYNNLANLKQLLNRPADYEELYNKAASLLNHSGVPYYNLSHAMIRFSFDLEKSQTALEKALSLNPEFNSDSSGQQPALIFLPLPQAFRLEEAANSRAIVTLKKQFFQQFCRPAVNYLSYLALILIFIAFFIWQIYTISPDRKICNRCGRLFHTLSYRKKHSRRLCRSCGQASSTPPLDHFIQSLAYLLGLFVPGGLQLFYGRLYSGVLLLLAAVFWLYYTVFPWPEISGLSADPWLNPIMPILLWFINLWLYLRIYLADRRKKREVSR